MSASSISAMPQAKMGYAATGASSIILPTDPGSFQFTQSAQVGYTLGSSSAFFTSTPVISLAGLPPGTTILVEAVLNLEGIQGYSSSGAIPNTGYANDESTLADHFPSLDNLFSSIKHYLPSATTVSDGFASAARVVAGGTVLAHTVARSRQSFMPRLTPSSVRITELN